jgi:predicted nucleic acid-binding protein
MPVIVVDTNIILSALITDSKTRELIVNLESQLVAPEVIHDEINNYRDLIKEKSGLNSQDLEELLERLFSYIQIVPTTNLEDYMMDARDELEEIDQDDAVFLATALSVDGKIWSDDSDLHQQDLVEVYTTEEILKKVY